MPIDKYYLNLAGEYRVASELFKRGLFATITYGNKKGADIYAIGPSRKTAVIEVKASNTSRFVTGFYQKYVDEMTDHPTSGCCARSRIWMPRSSTCFPIPKWRRRKHSGTSTRR